MTCSLFLIHIIGKKARYYSHIIELLLSYGSVNARTIEFYLLTYYNIYRMCVVTSSTNGLCIICFVSRSSHDLVLARG